MQVDCKFGFSNHHGFGFTDTFVPLRTRHEALDAVQLFNKFLNFLVVCEALRVIRIKLEALTDLTIKKLTPLNNILKLEKVWVIFEVHDAL